jgi:hypothetical protein
VRLTLARLHSAGRRHATVADVAALLDPPIPSTIVATRLWEISQGVGPEVPGVRVVATSRFSYSLLSRYELAPRGPMPTPTISPEALRAISGSFARASAAIAAMTEAYRPAPPRPKWYRRGMLGRFGFRFAPRDWSIGVTVGDETVSFSPLPCVVITFDRAGD